MDAWNWEDAAILTDDAIHLNWPGRMRMQFDFTTYTVNRVPNDRYEEQVQTLKDLFADASAYGEMQGDRETNLKLEAMQGLYDGSRALHLHAEEAREIVESIKFLQQRGIERIVLVGGYEADLVTDFLKENEIPVIVDNVHRLPERPEEDVDKPYRLPAMLHEAGLLVGLGYDIGMNSRARNLPFLAGTAAAYGISKAEALMLITANNAKILGIDDLVGTLEKGKQATLFVSGGDALDMRGNLVEHVFIDGRKVELEAMQQRLYKKYLDKYSTGE
jgi:imidazolonepropionase-like amidohydrolase